MSPGCALAVVTGGRVALARGYGFADLARRLPITPRTVFDIASTSKQFTAASVLLLAARGRLSLDDDVRNSASFKKDQILLPGASVRVFANVKLN